MSSEETWKRRKNIDDEREGESEREKTLSNTKTNTSTDLKLGDFILLKFLHLLPSVFRQCRGEILEDRYGMNRWRRILIFKISYREVMNHRDRFIRSIDRVYVNR